MKNWINEAFAWIIIGVVCVVVLFLLWQIMEFFGPLLKSAVRLGVRLAGIASGVGALVVLVIGFGYVRKTVMARQFRDALFQVLAVLLLVAWLVGLSHKFVFVL